MDLLTLSKKLISKPSISPNDEGCQPLIRSILTEHGFTLSDLSSNDTTNTLAIYGNSGPLLLFSGHTDVVPPGPIDDWHSDPFQPLIKDGKLYGRGSADMKAALAAMVCTACDWTKSNKINNFRIGLAITSDEEKSTLYGSRVIAEYLKKESLIPDYVLIGEATSEQEFGDTIKVGRRGSLSVQIEIRGKQGHIAYPQLAQNAIHSGLPMLQALVDHAWDQGNKDFQPTSFQISNIAAGAGAGNIIPGSCRVNANFRFCPESTPEALMQQTEIICQQFCQQTKLDWHLFGLPYHSKPGKLRKACAEAIHSITNINPISSTKGGGSDGRFFAPLGCEVVEFGLINKTIHQANEHITVSNLHKLQLIYQQLLRNIFG